MALLVPNVTPLVTVTLVFASIFGRDYGPVAWLLSACICRSYRLGSTHR